MINFVRAVLAIQDYAAREELDSREMCLLLAIFRCMNDLFFPDGMVEISNSRLLEHAAMNGSKRDDTLRAVRQRLADRGVISFRPGDRRRDKPAYRIHWDVLGLSADIAPKNQGKTQDSGEIAPQIAPDNQGKKRGKGPVNNINNNRTPEDTENGKPKRSTGDDDDLDSRKDARARGKLITDNGVPIPDMRASPEQSRAAGVALYWLHECWPGGKFPAFWGDQIANAAHEFNVPEHMMGHAIRRAAEAGAASPVAYTIEIMRDMANNNVTNLYDWVKHREKVGF